MKYVIFLALILSPLLFAQEILTLNPMARILLLDLGLSPTQIKTLELKNADPHHHEWSTTQVKAILNAELLIAPPLELNTGLANLLKKRTKPTLQLNVAKSAQSFAHAHFWLYPETSCALRSQIETFLKKSISACPYSKLSLPKLTSFSFIVVSHQALAPIFENSGVPLLVLNTTTHGEINSQKLKELSLKVKSYNKASILWIKELPYHAKIPLEKFIKKEDKLIEVKLLSEEELFSSLKTLIKSLE